MSSPPQWRTTIDILRKALKAGSLALSLILTFPLAVLAAFGRFSAGFQGGGHFMAMIPGLVGDYLRTAYYSLTLQRFSLRSRISFGSFFAQSRCFVGQGVYIGAYCILGVCKIGDRTQIASHVQVPGGRHQHSRDEQGHIQGSMEDAFESVSIGADCWIGASAIIMANVGSGTTVGAGSVVTRAIPSGVVAVGVPARTQKPVAS